MSYKPDRPLPAHVTIPNWSGYQVRIVRDGHEYSASFAWSVDGGREKALSDAVCWRDKLLAALPAAGNAKGAFREKPLAHKTSWGRVGITRYVSADNRRTGRPLYLRFGVNWIDHEEKRRTKSFQVGRVGEFDWAFELHAANTAEAFRTEWEFCRASGLLFDDARYRAWRDTTLYPFYPESVSVQRVPAAA